MPEILIHATARSRTGSRPSRKGRAAGEIPAVVYGHGLDAAIPVAVDARALAAAMGTAAGTNALLDLEVDGKRHLAIAREFQRHPTRHTVLHVDFQVVRRDQQVAAEVPVVLVGEAVLVQHGDGLVDQQLFVLPVHALPNQIPNSIEVDVSGLTIGGAVRVGDVALPEGAVTDLDVSTPIVIGEPPRVAGSEAGAAVPAEGEVPPTGPASDGEGAGA